MLHILRCLGKATVSIIASELEEKVHMTRLLLDNAIYHKLVRSAKVNREYRLLFYELTSEGENLIDRKYEMTEPEPLPKIHTKRNVLSVTKNRPYPVCWTTQEIENSEIEKVESVYHAERVALIPDIPREKENMDTPEMRRKRWLENLRRVRLAEAQKDKKNSYIMFVSTPTTRNDLISPEEIFPDADIIIEEGETLGSWRDKIQEKMEEEWEQMP